ncbi:MAG: IS200/IS605 family transposase [Chloroflexi bacterium]|nr:IS200/IS605 family transposase [Chloroflexota bacterium]
MPLKRCFYHIVWATYRPQALLSPEVETLVYATIRRKSALLRSEIFALNGMPDHVHVVVSIKPSVAVATWIKTVKGSAAHDVNQLIPQLENYFRWQGGCGVFTLSPKNLPFVIDYVERQKTHHAANQLHDELERIDAD